MLRIRNLEAGYGQLKVLRGVSIHVSAGEIVTMIGANGAGKSTLLRTIAGLVETRAGEVLFAGEDMRRVAPQQRVRRGCVLVPEGRQLFAPLSVRENLLLGAYPQVRRGHHAEVTADLATMTELFPILAERQHQLAGTLSGGEQQMLAIARALMSRPRLIMLDEPSLGLGPMVVRSIFQVILKLREQGNTVLLVEQNARAALGIADRGYVLETGQITVQGPAAELLGNQDVQRAYLGKDYRSIDEKR
jgi:branched-chain amino acid transport system ATP-binding protein